MKISITQLLIFSMIAFSSCKKEKVEDAKPQIADMQFLATDFRIPTDTTSTDITYLNTLILKGDYTWTFDFNGAKSNGTYNWTPTESYRAQLKFTILQWTTLSTNILMSNKIKTVFESITNCAFPGPNITGLYLFDDNLKTTLRADKK